MAGSSEAGGDRGREAGGLGGSVKWCGSATGEQNVIGAGRQDFWRQGAWMSQRTKWYYNEVPIVPYR